MLWTVLAILLALIVGLVIYFIIIYNGLVALKNNVKKNWHNIDVLLKQRFDELPKLVKVCEHYLKHEAETLEKVIKARAMMAGANDMAGRGKAEGMLTEALKSLFAVTENYPGLKTDRNFATLQARVTELENEIADRRELFNESVNIYNIRIERIPGIFVARLLNYQEKEMWKINAAECSDLGINFSS